MHPARQHRPIHSRLNPPEAAPARHKLLSASDASNNHRAAGVTPTCFPNKKTRQRRGFLNTHATCPVRLCRPCRQQVQITWLRIRQLAWQRQQLGQQLQRLDQQLQRQHQQQERLQRREQQVLQRQELLQQVRELQQQERREQQVLLPSYRKQPEQQQRSQ